MFNQLAVSLADKLKEANPEETAPHDVLVFGLTLIFNMLSTLVLLLLVGLYLGEVLLIMEVAVSFMILRILTGGAHLSSSLSCSIFSTLYIVVSNFLPSTSVYIFIYFAISIILLLRYAPYYESHQVIHSSEWERKKKNGAIIGLIVFFILSLLFNQPGFIIGGLLQFLLLTPIGIGFTHAVDKLFKGGENNEEIS